MAPNSGDALVSALSWLFVPAAHPERFVKAAASGTDVVVVDLEDAVAVDGKDQARDAMRAH